METTFLIKDKQYTIRPYESDDEKSVLKLWQIAFGKEMPTLLWNWKYHANPYGNQWLLCLNSENEVVVSYCGIPYQTNCQGKIVKITQLMDIMSHPDYRKSGLFIQIANAFFERFGNPEQSVVLYGFPGKYHFDIGQKYLEYKALPLGACFLKAQTANYKAQLFADNQKFANNRNKYTKNHTSNSSMHRLDLSTSDTDIANEIWQHCSKDYQFSIIRDAKFIRWRFVNNPLHKYEIWCYSQNKTIAYAVLSIIDKRAILVDILAPNLPDAIEDFMIKMAWELNLREVETVETWLPPNHFIAQAMIKIGFSSSSEPLGIIPTCRIFDRSIEFNWLSNHIFYTMADADLF